MTLRPSCACFQEKYPRDIDVGLQAFCAQIADVYSQQAIILCDEGREHLLVLLIACLMVRGSQPGTLEPPEVMVRARDLLGRLPTVLGDHLDFLESRIVQKGSKQ